LGKLGFLLSVIMISAIVSSLIVNIHFYRVIDQLNAVINQLNAVNNQLNEEISDLQIQIQELERILDLQHTGISQLHLLNYETTVHTVKLGTDYVTVNGTILNSGSDSITNVFLLVRIYDSEGSLLKTEQISLGTVEGKSHKNFGTDIEAEGANSVTFYLGHLHLLGEINSNLNSS